MSIRGCGRVARWRSRGVEKEAKACMIVQGQGFCNAQGRGRVAVQQVIAAKLGISLVTFRRWVHNSEEIKDSTCAFEPATSKIKNTGQRYLKNSQM